MAIKLWVDDIRKEPAGWVRARSVTEAIRILDTMEIEEVSLDYDISMKVQVGIKESGYSEPRPFASNETFEPVARFIASHWYGNWDSAPKIKIHSANKVGAEQMKFLLLNFDNVKIEQLPPCNRFEEEGWS